MIQRRDYGEGARVVTSPTCSSMAAFPLAEAVDFMLTTGQSEMARPVEIEFAGMVEGQGKGKIYWLQIRPIIDRKDMGRRQYRRYSRLRSDT